MRNQSLIKDIRINDQFRKKSQSENEITSSTCLFVGIRGTRGGTNVSIISCLSSLVPVFRSESSLKRLAASRSLKRIDLHGNEYPS